MNADQVSRIAREITLERIGQRGHRTLNGSGGATRPSTGSNGSHHGLGNGSLNHEELPSQIAWPQIWSSRNSRSPYPFEQAAVGSAQHISNSEINPVGPASHGRGGGMEVGATVPDGAILGFLVRNKWNLIFALGAILILLLPGAEKFIGH